jgi:diaminohydroxyphosphoribosylaminopyrimidine deaminase/5-amino-6-(5-phosphoribosylamino)uracil reductase
MEIERVFSQIDAEFEQHLERVRAFVRQPSISGEGVGMQEMAGLLRDTIVRLGGTAEIVPTPGWPVVYGAIDAGRPKTLLLYGMYDVQPVEGEEWMVPPFAGETVDLAGGLRELGARGITRVLVEGGAGLAAALLRAGLVDRIAWFRAPRVMGGDGIPAVAPFGLERLADMPAFARTGIETLGHDVLETFSRA